MEAIDHKAKRLIRYYERLIGSRDPVKIAEYANIRIAILPLGEIAGNYKLIKRKRWIFINDNIPADSPMFRVVLAHELGHALLHRKENCAFIKSKTLLLTSGIEREANQFAASLLISDDMLQDYAGYTQDQFCQRTGYPKELIEVRLK
nr:MAG TPA: IrrE protein [Caudoviricetes sp.]